MRIAAIGRTEILFNTILELIKNGHEIACIITAKEAPEYNITSNDFELLATRLNIPFLKTSRINDAEVWLRQFSPIDISVSINYTGVIQQSIIDIFRIGVLNAHGGDLPRYRGNACVAWAIINGEEKVGLCIHKMIGGELDSGDIIARDYYYLNEKSTITQVFDWMTTKTVDLFIDAVNSLNENPSFLIEKQSKNPKDAFRVYPRIPEDGLISWSKNAIEILRLINATNKPFGGAFSFINGNKAFFWEAEIIEDSEVFQAIPGQVLKLTDKYVDVSTGDMKKIRATKVEIDGLIISPQKAIKSIRNRFKSHS